MRKLCIAVILASLVTVPLTFAKDDAPAENKTAKKSKNAEKKGGVQHKGGKDAKKSAPSK